MTIRFFQVGGSVRDQIMGLKSKDIDYSVEAPSFEAMRDEIVRRGGKIFVETPEYLTIRAMMPETGACDFVLCRKEGAYRDGRRPETVEMGSVYDDLARRDFTVNAIAIDLDTGEYIDPFDGRRDIQRNLLRCVGSAEARFTEDGLRILRALRFRVTKGFWLHDDIVCMFDDEKVTDLLSGVSTERVREELHKMFACNTLESLNVLQEYDWLRIVVFDKHKIKLMPTMKDF